jgi:hypothetical protein
MIILFWYYSVKLHLILPLLVKISSKLNKNDWNLCFEKMLFYMKYILKYFSDRILCACLCSWSITHLVLINNYLQKHVIDIYYNHCLSITIENVIPYILWFIAMETIKYTILWHFYIELCWMGDFGWNELFPSE